MSVAMKVYTRGGDDGTTQLLAAGRVSKQHPRIHTVGDLDELNAVIGTALAAQPAAPVAAWLLVVQEELFTLGAEVAAPEPDKLGKGTPRITQPEVDRLEAWIDELTEPLPQLKFFILPGGSPCAAQLQLARSVCRRAERSLRCVHDETPQRAELLAYVNRLSDFLFTAARFENHQRGVDEPRWLGRKAGKLKR